MKNKHSTRSSRNDVDILCRDIDYAEMTKKENSMAFVTTMVKETRSSSKPCDEQQCDAPTETQRVFDRKLTTPYGVDKCTCDTQQDWFALGATRCGGARARLVARVVRYRATWDDGFRHSHDARAEWDESSARRARKTQQRAQQDPLCSLVLAALGGAVVWSCCSLAAPGVIFFGRAAG